MLAISPRAVSGAGRARALADFGGLRLLVVIGDVLSPAAVAALRQPTRTFGC